ncbi:hypothetical protein [Galbibacter sp.]|uniref:hypothetical protein n=1 Tax=Galbibacter sp. TaxID=2918471 RepID=UPI002C6EB638|nr:hypothetical protein [Galbibacter sp.]HLV63791.1 hypothetical protein [Galbibacter sp.]
MEKDKGQNDFAETVTSKAYKEVEEEKKQKLLNLIVEIIVEATFKEYYEKSH